IDSMASRVDRLLLNNAMNQVVGEINDTRPDEHKISIEDIAASKDTGIMTRWFGDASRINNPLVQIIDRWLKNAKRGQASMIHQLNKMIDEKLDGVDTNKFLQKDEEGNLTGNFISKFSHGFYTRVSLISDNLRSALDAIDPASKS